MKEYIVPVRAIICVNLVIDANTAEIAKSLASEWSPEKFGLSEVRGYWASDDIGPGNDWIVIGPRTIEYKVIDTTVEYIGDVEEIKEDEENDK